MRKTSELRRIWSPACRFEQRTLTMYSGATLRGLNAVAYEAFQALDGVMRTFQYVPRSNSPAAWETGAYNCRKITGGEGFSLHAYGIAADINARTNPYGDRLITDMPLAMVAAIKSIRTKGGLSVFRWGGDYRTKKDAMHYEVVASPDELRKGIDWASVLSEPPSPTDPSTWPTLAKSDRGPSVRHLNELLSEAGFEAGNTSVFGPNTLTAVLEYQASRKLTVDGIAGLQTWTALINRLPAVAASEPSPFKSEARSAPARPRVKLGSRGPEVLELQRRLKDLGHDPGQVDGIFGTKTQAAVKAFQKSTRLQSDGICGKLTWRAILA